MNAAAKMAGGDPSPEEVARVAGWLGRVGERAASVDPGGTSYLVVTPLGMADRAWLQRRLRESGVMLAGRLAFSGWPEVSTALQVKRVDGEGLRRAVLFEVAWERLFPGATAEAWALAPGSSHARAERVKPVLRREMPSVRLDLGSGSRRPAVLHPFHLADSPDATEEARRLLAALSLSRASCAPRYSAALNPSGSLGCWGSKR